MREDNYRDNKDIKEPLNEMFAQVAADYKLGRVISYKKIEIGYEDNNFILKASSGKYMVKVFGNYRDIAECRRYLSILEAAQLAGVSTPKLFRFKDVALYQYNSANLAVFRYIDGKNFYELGREPSSDEANEIVRQAAIINRIDYKPEFVFDDWAIINFLKQYKTSYPHLSVDERASLEPLKVEFEKLNLVSLPQALVHGDIITTNTMLDYMGKIFIIDFACANYVPRIIELAVLACNLLVTMPQDAILNKYEQYNILTPQERELFPLFVKLAHAMHVIGAVRERDIYGNMSKENDYWLKQGRAGLGIIT